jgi:hypothetical protein
MPRLSLGAISFAKTRYQSDHRSYEIARLAIESARAVTKCRVRANLPNSHRLIDRREQPIKGGVLLHRTKGFRY